MSEGFDYSIVLPAYQEARNLELLLPKIQSEMRKLGIAHEILVVDTPAPMDDTAAVCRTLGVRYVNRLPGTVFGDAVRTGIREASGRKIHFMDADGSHSPEFIPQMISRAGDCDVVIASRYISGGATENNPLLIVMSRFLNVTNSIILGLPVRDVSNSFKIYPAQMLKSLQLRCDNFDIIEEILFKLKRAHPQLRILEIPYTFRKRVFGKTKRNLVVFMLTYLITILRLRFSANRPPLSSKA